MRCISYEDKNNNNILQLDGDMRFGSSSPRRINYLKSLFPNLKIKNLRGNQKAELKKLKEKKTGWYFVSLCRNKKVKIKI